MPKSPDRVFAAFFLVAGGFGASAACVVVETGSPGEGGAAMGGACLMAEHGHEKSSAERKIRAARLLRRIPSLREKLESGHLNLTLLELAMGCAHREKLTNEELEELCDTLSGMSCDKAEREIASRYPLTFVAPRDRIRPLNEELSEVRFTASHELLEKLDEVRGLLAHSHPGATLAELIDVLATEYRERHHPEEKLKRMEERKAKKAETPPKPVETPAAPRVEDKRVAPPAMVRELIRTTGYQCAFTDPSTGKSCASKYGLEVDHVRPWSEGGKTELSNLRFLCRSHHARISFLKFGDPTRFAHRRP
jgi:5-methylcytosine-specific restriction endonuclease McrA